MGKQRTLGDVIPRNPDTGRPYTDMAGDSVVELLRSAVELDENFVVSDSTRLDEFPNLDSLGYVRLVMEIEKVLSDRLSMEEIIGMETVGHIRALLVAKGKLPIES